MRVINVRAGKCIESLAEGETFLYCDDYWIVSDYADTHDKTLCVSLSTGFTQFLIKETVVIPVTAEVHIL